MFKIKAEPANVPMYPAGDAEQRLLEAHANLDNAHGQIEYLAEKSQGLALEVKRLRGDLSVVARGCDALADQALPHLTTPTWPQVEPARAVICDELAADTDGFQGFWDDDDGDPDAGTAYFAEQLPSRQAVSS